MVRKILDQFYLSCGILAAINLIAMVVLIIMQIVARFFNTHIPSSDDISGYMVAWITFLGLSYAMSKNDHIRVDLILNILPRKIKFFLSIIVILIGCLLIAVFSYYVFLAVKEAYDYGDLTTGFVPMLLWMVQTPYLLGVVALLVAMLDRLFSTLISGEILNDKKPIENQETWS